MWRRKKFLIIGVLAAILLVGSIAGVTLAQTGNTANNQPKTLLARVAEILGIDQQKLEDAFIQARNQMRDEALQRLVDEGKITQEQAERYKAWLKSKPDTKQYEKQLREWRQAKPSLPPELKEWLQAKPDIPLPGRLGKVYGGRGEFWGPPCLP